MSSTPLFLMNKVQLDVNEDNFEQGVIQFSSNNKNVEAEIKHNRSTLNNEPCEF